MGRQTSVSRCQQDVRHLSEQGATNYPYLYVGLERLDRAFGLMQDQLNTPLGAVKFPVRPMEAKGNHAGIPHVVGLGTLAASVWTLANLRRS